MILLLGLIVLGIFLNMAFYEFRVVKSKGINDLTEVYCNAKVRKYLKRK